MPEPALAGALLAWRRALGGRHVHTDLPTLTEYETATFPTRQRVVAVLRPVRAEQVAAALRIATQHRVAVHPISRGFNWGYGCRVPTRSHAAVLDLGGLCGIRRFSEALGHVHVEPGVTFAQLADYLSKRHSRRVAPAIGSSLQASVLGNALERGIGIGSFANRVESLCNLDVVLPTGERIRTGFGRLPRATSQDVQRLGVGPSLDGLFSQSGLGVVVGATVWLARRCAYQGTVRLTIEPRQLGQAIVALREIIGAEVIRGVVKLNNRYSVLMGMYASAVLREGFFPIPRPLVLRGSERWWSSTITVVGDDPSELRARLAYVKRRLANEVKQVETTTVRRSGRRVLPDDVSVEPVPSVMYWRAAPPLPSRLAPRRDGRGALFCCPAVPLEPRHIQRAVALVEKHFLAMSFEPYVTVNMMTERVAYIVSGIFYDRRSPGEDARAMRAHHRAFAACIKQGYYPYRMGNQTMDEMPALVDDSEPVIGRIRRALDPAGVLADNRYGLR